MNSVWEASSRLFTDGENVIRVPPEHFDWLAVEGMQLVSDDQGKVPKLVKKVLTQELQAYLYLSETTNLYIPQLFGYVRILDFEYKSLHKKVPQYLIVMERLDVKPFPDKIPAHIVTQALRGIAAMAAAGTPHIDLHPGNIVLTVGDQVKFIDFGRTVFGYDISHKERRWKSFLFGRLDKSDPAGADLLLPRLQQVMTVGKGWTRVADPQERFRLMHVMLGAAWYTYLTQHRPETNPKFTKDWMDDYWYGDHDVSFSLRVHRGSVMWNTDPRTLSGVDEVEFQAKPPASPLMLRDKQVTAWDDGWHPEMVLRQWVKDEQIEFVVEQCARYFADGKYPMYHLPSFPRPLPSEPPRPNLQHQASWKRITSFLNDKPTMFSELFQPVRFEPRQPYKPRNATKPNKNNTQPRISNKLTKNITGSKPNDAQPHKLAKNNITTESKQRDATKPNNAKSSKLRDATKSNEMKQGSTHKVSRAVLLAAGLGVAGLGAGGLYARRRKAKASKKHKTTRT